MESMEVVRTLSWLKQRLIEVNKLQIEQAEIRLFFSVLGNDLRVHSYHDHKTKLVVGGLILGKNEVSFKSALGAEASNLVNYGTSKLKLDERSFEGLVNWLNECVKEHGYYKV